MLNRNYLAIAIGAVVVILAVIFINRIYRSGSGIFPKLAGKNQQQQTTTDGQGQTTNNDASESFEPSNVDRYLDYNNSDFEKAAVDKKRVYFFADGACTNCQEFLNNVYLIPEDVSVFKINYAEAQELTAKYNVTKPYTFVFVDANGNEIRRWYGGGVRELITNTKVK